MDTSTSLISQSERVKALRKFSYKPGGRLTNEELAHLMILEGQDLVEVKLPGVDKTLLQVVATPNATGFQVDNGNRTIPYRELELPDDIVNAVVVASISKGASSLGADSGWCYGLLMLGYWKNGDLAWLGADIWWFPNYRHPRSTTVTSFENAAAMKEFFDDPQGLEHFHAEDIYDSYHKLLQNRLDELRKLEATLMKQIVIVDMRRTAAHKMLEPVRQLATAAFK
jgi:hypothetical protein